MNAPLPVKRRLSKQTNIQRYPITHPLEPLLRFYLNAYQSLLGLGNESSLMRSCTSCGWAV